MGSALQPQQTQSSSQEQDASSPSEEVLLNIYTNNQPFSSTPGLGVYHSGVQVYGAEYTFAGMDSPSTGVFSHIPQRPPEGSEWVFKERLVIGKTKYSKSQVQNVLFEIKKRYPANTYNLLTRNCNHFADELCQELCSTSIPSWVNRAAKFGNAMKDLTGFDGTAAQPQAKTPQIEQEVQVQEALNLYPFINLKNIECLNEQTTHPILHAFPEQRRKSFLGKEEETFLESAADEQLLIHIPFTQNVKVRSLVIIGKQKNTAPKKLRFYVQKGNLNFDDVETAPSIQDVVLTEQQVLQGEHIQLKAGKFQNISHLTIFIECNQGSADTTQISKLILYGNPLQTTNVKDIKQME